MISRRLTHEQNDDIPEGAAGVRLLADGTAVHSVSQWLSANGWTVVTSEIGYVAKSFPELSDEQKAETGAFLQKLDDYDDVARVWAAVK